ncbi:MAG: iron deficiency-induced protein [Panacagrimonas sp.]|jgi:iron(III) transport system substrate-binding protein|nr:iron deficiency-induced protein [Panacagrimonas sp.]
MRRILCVLLLALSPAAAPAATELTVYTSRIEDLIKPVFDRYTRETGTPIRFITDKEGPLLQRLQAEGASTPADLLITVDAGNLWQAARLGVLQPVDSATLKANIPAHLRDPDNRWFGLSIRARTIVYSSARVKPAELSTYEALSTPAWNKRVCMRTSKKVYNQSLVGMMLAELGADRTEQIVRGWVGNFAAAPFASDNEVIEAIAAGRCDVGLVNTYYYGRMLRQKPDLPVKLFWPNQAGAKNHLGGVHVNVSGAGITTHTKNRDAAVKFLEWLSSSEAQHLFANLDLEFPVSPEVKLDPITAAWGPFKQDGINLAEAGKRQADAVRLMDRVGWR